MENNNDAGFGLEDHAWHLAQTLAMQDSRVARALRNIQKRNQETLRPKTAQDLDNIAKAQAKQERKALRKLETTRSH